MIRPIPLLLACVSMLTALGTPSSAYAQVLASERSNVTQMISGTEIEIDYSRPSMRGRTQIWGAMEPWDIAWTPGANNSTTFKFSNDVTINGVDVEAGKYGVWFELRENEPWRMMLNHDTTLFHLPYPPMDHEGLYKIIDIEHKEVDSYVETLRFDLQHIRPDGAIIEFQWATTRVELDLGVDPGYHMTFFPEEAAPFEGTWILDTSMARPPDSSIVKWRADMADNEGDLEGFEEWLSWFKPDQEVRLAYEPETGHLSGTSEFMAWWIGASMDVPNLLLVQKSEDIFVEAGLMNGTVMHVNDNTFWEFDLDESGQATLLLQRSARSDEIVGRAVREDSGE